jgi:hypothetical protein
MKRLRRNYCPPNIRMSHSNEFVIRYDKACSHLHYSICKTLGIDTTENWYSHIPEPVCQYEDIRVLWNQGIQTDREVLANRHDITIKNKKR